MADFETKKFDIILVGKTLPSLLIANALLDCGIKFVILDPEGDKLSQKAETNRYMLIDTQNHEVTASMIQSLTPGLLTKQDLDSTKYSAMLDRMGFSWFRGRYYYNCLQFWKTLDCNDIFRKLENLCEKLEFAESVFRVRWGDFERELDSVTVVEYLRKQCYLKSTVAWFNELACNFMDCDVTKLSMFWFVWCLKLSGGVGTLMNSSQVFIKTEAVSAKLEKKLESNIVYTKQRKRYLICSSKNGLEFEFNENTRMETSFLFSFLDVKGTRNLLKCDDDSCQSQNMQVFLEMLFQLPKLSLEVPVMGNISLIKSAASIFCHNDMGKTRSCHRLFPSPELSVFSMRTSFFGKDAIDIYSKCFDQSQAVAHFNSLLSKMYLRVEGTEISTSQLQLHPPMPSKDMLSSCLVSESELKPWDRFLIFDPLFLTKYPSYMEGKLLTAIQYLRKEFPSFDICKGSISLINCPKGAMANVDDDARSSGPHSSVDKMFHLLPTLTMTLTGLSFYLLFCCYHQFGDELKEIVALLYVYYRFDATRDRLFAPKSTRFQRFAKFFQIQPVVSGVNRIYGLAGSSALNTWSEGTKKEVDEKEDNSQSYFE